MALLYGGTATRNRSPQYDQIMIGRSLCRNFAHEYPPNVDDVDVIIYVEIWIDVDVDLVVGCDCNGDGDGDGDDDIDNDDDV